MAKGRAALALQRGGIDDKLKVELEARKRAQATPGAELTDAQLDQLALESGPRVDPTEDLNINLPTEDLQERMVGGYNVGTRRRSCISCTKHKRASRTGNASN